MKKLFIISIFSFFTFLNAENLLLKRDLSIACELLKNYDLNKTLTLLTQSFDRLFRRAKVKKNLLGYLRSVEVTHNEDDNSYHPHIHVLMMVRPSFFQSKKDYITQKEWSDMWSQSLKVDYVPMVDIRIVKEKGVGEAKFSAIFADVPRDKISSNVSYPYIAGTTEGANIEKITLMPNDIFVVFYTNNKTVKYTQVALDKKGNGSLKNAVEKLLTAREKS